MLSAISNADKTWSVCLVICTYFVTYPIGNNLTELYITMMAAWLILIYSREQSKFAICYKLCFSEFTTLKTS